MRVGRDLYIGLYEAVAFERVANHLFPSSSNRVRVRVIAATIAQRDAGERNAREESRLEALHALKHRRFVSVGRVASRASLRMMITTYQWRN